MLGSQSGGGGSNRSISKVARICGQEPMLLSADGSDHGGTDECEDRASGFFRQRNEFSSSRMSFSSSMNQKTPARSYFQHSTQDSPSPFSVTKDAAQEVREDTAELASWALSDIASSRSEQSPSRHHTASTPQQHSCLSSQLNQHDISRHESNTSPRPKMIQEVSEPTSPQSSNSLQKPQCQSALTDLFRNSPSSEGDSYGTDEDELLATTGVHAVTVREGIISQPSERTTLLNKRTAYGSIKDLEGQQIIIPEPKKQIRAILKRSKEQTARIVRVASNAKSWDRQQVWEYGVRQPASFIPPVILGLLLNVLDALSYGMILFPLGNATFTGLGPEGISMFYVSCIVSQLTYSLGGSIFKGGIGSEMIEVVPFFHRMAFTILSRVGEGEDKKAAVLATTIAAYAISSIVTGAIFYIMGLCKIGSLIGFFPRHILIGCIGGVGWFLVATGLEVSARLDGNLEYNIETLQKLFQSDTVVLWIIPLILAIMLQNTKRFVKHPLTDATFFFSIVAVFYYYVAAIEELNLPELRNKGWIFAAPDAGKPFYSFYELYNWRLTDWRAILSTVPAMLALTFFGVLHVPINVPALGLSSGVDNVDVDRELRAHGISNALSGLCGSIQNYLVYTNSVLFMRSGGDSRVAGVMLAAATFGILIIGPVIIGFIPIMVVGALIFFLGLDLLKEALVDTWGKVHRLEYLTILIIVVTMGAYDFVVGILVGIILACVSFVLQTSQISAVRGKLYGGVANSTVRRHPIQQRFLLEAGKQVHVMKLAGYLFFGTIVGVEKQIRELLREEFFRQQPIRFLVLDLYNVDGVDFSAGEAFKRTNRLLALQGVQLAMCGLEMDSDVGKSLRNVGLFDNEDGVYYTKSLNSALEYCENELLKAFYHQRDLEADTESTPAFMGKNASELLGAITDSRTEVPQPEQASLPYSEMMLNSPRMHHLHQIATATLNQESPASPQRWEDYHQPLQLILQTFSTVSDKPEDFWYKTASFFVRKDYAAGSVLYQPGDRADGFYLLESGMLKAKYDLPQGNYSELIVAGTTCGELPFFSATERTSTTLAERNCVTWMLDESQWRKMQDQHADVSQELLKITLKLTRERMNAITKYMLLTSG